MTIIITSSWVNIYDSSRAIYDNSCLNSYDNSVAKLLLCGTKKEWFWYYLHRAKIMQELLQPVGIGILYLCDG